MQTPCSSPKTSTKTTYIEGRSPGNKATYPYRVHCLSACGDTGGDQTLGSPGNQVRLSMAQNGGRPTVAGGVFMGSSLIFLTEQAPPRITTAGAPPATTWTKGPFTLTSTVNDYGLGPRQASISAPNAPGPPPRRAARAPAPARPPTPPSARTTSATATTAAPPR